MKPLTAEWIEKAEGDYATLCREMRARKHRNPDAACFHAQQCAEKYLKGRLTEAAISFPKIHDLVSLMEQVLVAEPLWETYRKDLAYLSDCAVSYRYPGESATEYDAKCAFHRCRAIRKAAREALGLSDK